MTDISPQELLRPLAEDVRGIPFPNEGERKKCVLRAEMLLRRIFGPESRQAESVDNVNFWSMGSTLEAVRLKYWRQGREELAAILETAAEEIDLFGTLAAASEGHVSGAMPTSRRVFVVHGHDDGLKETVARVLGALGLDPVILHEQANKGRTIIEKFEDYADVGFAVVLLTPDDVGYAAAKGRDNAAPRARQNVILEFGFFLGQLTRSRVVALYDTSQEMELPSDYSGVIFIPIDKAGGWRLKLVQELTAAGIEVDANKLLAAES